MQQSIATARTDVISEKPRDKNWKTISAEIWSAIAAAGKRIAPGNWYFKKGFGSDTSASLNVDAIGARLAINSRARADGKDEQPPSAEEVISGTQREIVVFFRELQRKAQRRATKLHDKLHRLGDSIDVPDATGTLRDIPSRCENAVLRFTAEHQSQLDFMADREIQLRQHYEAICKKDESGEIAGRASSPLLNLVLIAALLAAAGIALGKLSVSGLGGVALISAPAAVSIALLAVVMPFLLALAVSSAIDHDTKVRQFIGWLIGGITMVLVGTLALFVAYYLAAITANPEITVRSVLDSILVDPAVIGVDVTAWVGSVSGVAPKIGFGIVILAGLMAFTVGYRSNGPHPQLAAVNSALNRVRNKRDRLTRRLRKRVNTIVDEADGEVTDVCARLKKQTRQYSRLVDEAIRLPVSLSTYDIALEDACNILLDRYRVVNGRVRKTDLPLSFSEHICFRQDEEPGTPMIDDEARKLEKTRQAIVELESDIVQVRQKLRDLNWRIIRSLEDVPAAD